jgi:hypothetical protein
MANCSADRGEEKWTVSSLNDASSAKKARAIVEAAARARGQAAPPIVEPVEVEGDDATVLAARIVAAGKKARNQK